MDFAGQRLAERIYTFLIIGFTTLGFVLGYIKDDFGITTTFWKIGAFLALIICIPSWPWFNRNPLPWQKPASAAATATTNDKKDKNSTSSSIEMKPLTKSD